MVWGLLDLLIAKTDIRSVKVAQKFSPERIHEIYEK